MSNEYKLIVLWDIDRVLIDVDPDAHKELRWESVKRFLSGDVSIYGIIGKSYECEADEKLLETYENVFYNIILAKGDDETVKTYVVKKILNERAHNLSIPFGDILEGIDNEEMKKELMKIYGQVIKERINSIEKGASKQIFYPTEIGKKMYEIRKRADKNIIFGILSSGNEDVQKYKLGLVEGKNGDKDNRQRGLFDRDLIFILPDKRKRIEETVGEIKEKYPKSNIILLDDNEENALEMSSAGGIGIKVGSEPGNWIVVSDTMFEANNWIDIGNGIGVLDKSKINGPLLNNLYALLVKE